MTGLTARSVVAPAGAGTDLALSGHSWLPALLDALGAPADGDGPLAVSSLVPPASRRA